MPFVRNLDIFRKEHNVNFHWNLIPVLSIPNMYTLRYCSTKSDIIVTSQLTFVIIPIYSQNRHKT